MKERLAETYEALRPMLFSIAYRMLGSVAEAEDVVQDAFLRYQRALAEQPGEIDSPKAYLSAVVTRLAIDHLRSARVRREQYVGEWLPEPVVTDETRLEGARYVEEADSLSMAFLLLLERLTPVERAVFLLHDVFDYGYDEIARIVGKSEDNCRQLAARARRHVREEKPRFEASQLQREALADRFLRPSARATSRAWSSSSPPMQPSTATAAARPRRGRARSSAATASRSSWPASAGRRGSSA